MADPYPSIISHVSLGVADVDKAAKFYDPVMAAIGSKRIMEHPGAVAYGKVFPEFWIQIPFSGKPATVGEGVHIAFLTDGTKQVDAFYKAAMEAGATCDGPPGPRPDYGEPYYAAFVRDIDGNKIEAMFWDFEMAEKLGIGM